MTDPIAVSQRAREAAALAWVAWRGNSHVEDEIMDIHEGRNDSHPLVQAFAQFESETRKDEREKLIPIIATAIRQGEPAPCCEGGPQWGHAWGCQKCPD